MKKSNVRQFKIRMILVLAFTVISTFALESVQAAAAEPTCIVTPPITIVRKGCDCWDDGTSVIAYLDILTSDGKYTANDIASWQYNYSPAGAEQQDSAECSNYIAASPICK